MNKQVYMNAYDKMKKLWWVNDFTGMMVGIHVNKAFSRKFQAFLENWFFKQFPRRKVFNSKLIPDDVLALARKEYQEVALRWVDHKRHQEKLLNDFLNKSAAAYEIVPDSKELQVTYQQSIGTYRSQPNKWGYAKADVLKRQELLRDSGFASTIVEVSDGYELWSGLNKYDLDVLQRRNPKTMLELAIQCFLLGQNPKVLYPFLPDDIYQESTKGK